MEILVNPEQCLSDALHIPRGVTALVGGGGKTSLMFRLAAELSQKGRVIVATTTHVQRPVGITVLDDPSLASLSAALASETLVFVGKTAREGKMTAPEIEVSQLAAVCDYALVEADGAKGRPLKAPAVYEPVIPRCSSLVIALAGLDGVGRPISEVAHRPALFAAALKTTEQHVVRPADLAHMLTSADGQRRDVEASMRFAIVLNKADNAERLRCGAETAALVDPMLAERILIVSLKKEV